MKPGETTEIEQGHILYAMQVLDIESQFAVGTKCAHMQSHAML